MSFLFNYRFLATGETYGSLAAQYRVGKTTILTIVPEVCDAIWQTMRSLHMRMPQVSTEWEEIASDFHVKWNFQHCVGAIDGKHIVLQSPHNSGSLFFNYKGTFSIVLMALVDANYSFIMVDIGAYGKQSDAGIFANTDLGRALLTPEMLHLPNDAPLVNAPDLGHMPYVIVGDEAFPLQKHLMRPYPGRSITENQQMYNYRHSRARRIVECAFGILSGRWRIFRTKIAVLPETVTLIVQAATVLHNMLQKESTQSLYMNMHDQPTNQRRAEECDTLRNLRSMGTRGSSLAVDVRNKFTNYFVSNPLPWQDEYVKRGLYN